MPGIKAGIVGSKERRKEISEKQQTRAFHSAIYRRRFTRRIDPMKRNESSAFKFFSLRQNRFRKSRNVRLIIFITIETAVITRFLICQFEFEKNVTKQCALCAVEFRQIRTGIFNCSRFQKSRRFPTPSSTSSRGIRVQIMSVPKSSSFIVLGLCLSR